MLFTLNNKIFDNKLKHVDLIVDIIAIGIIRLEFKKLNNLSRFNNDSNFNNNLKSNQNDYTLDDYNPEIKNSDDYNLIQAETWMDELTRKKDINISTIASRENKEVSYICKILNLVFLAPDIKKTILCEKAKLGITLLDLYKCANEVNWNEQRRLLNML